METGEADTLPERMNDFKGLGMLIVALSRLT